MHLSLLELDKLFSFYGVLSPLKNAIFIDGDQTKLD